MTIHSTILLKKISVSSKNYPIRAVPTEPGPGGQSDAPEFALSKYDAISIAWCRWPSDAVVDYQCVWYAVDNLRTLRLQLVFQDSCDGWADQRGTR